MKYLWNHLNEILVSYIKILVFLSTFSLSEITSKHFEKPQNV